MIGLGMQLTGEDFRRCLAHPRALITGALGQIMLLPLVGLTLAQLFAAEPIVAIGFVLLSACPGGITSNMCVYLARGDTALSVSLTIITSLLAGITIPFWLHVATGVFSASVDAAALPVADMVTPIIAMTVIPVFIGMSLRYFAPALVEASRGVLEVLLINFLILMVVIVVIAEWALLSSIAGTLLAGVLALNLLNLALGYLIGIIGGLDQRSTVTVAIELGIQNGTLGIVVAVNLAEDIRMALPSAAYALSMLLITGLIIMSANQRRDRKLQPQAD